MDCRLHRKGLILVFIGFLMSTATLAQSQQEWHDSLTTLIKKIERSPNSVDLRLKKAAVDVELGLWNYAIEEYGRVLELDSANLAAHYFRAYAHSHLRRYDLAKYDYEACLAIMPRYFEAQLGLAMVKRKMGMVVEVLDDLNQLIQMFPDSAVAYAARAGYEMEQRQYELALYDWEQAILLHPDNIDFLISKVETLLLLERKKEAHSLLQKALRKGVPRYALKEWLDRCK